MTSAENWSRLSRLLFFLVCHTLAMRVLIVDDEAAPREFLGSVVSGWGHDVEQASDGEEALLLLQTTSVDVIFCDLMMPRLDGFEMLRQLRQLRQDVPPTILMTAFGSLDKALKTIHELGGFWFLEKPIDVTALELLLSRAAEQRRLGQENQELRRQLSFSGLLGDLIGQTPPMQEVFALIRQAAPTTAAVLITGESGTGKELAARALHRNSRREGGPFIAINCSAIPESLIESELFGHERGAFTGAVERRIGAIQAAEGGTLFLDELGEMPLPMQVKLLRVLEDLRFRRLGGTREYQADVRIVAATNRDPISAIKDGKLREDLFYRLNVFQIQLPPLRDRKEDIPRIVEAMVATMNRKHGTAVKDWSPAFMDYLLRARWEGNVRELRNVVERAVIIAGFGTLEGHHLAPGFRGLPDANPTFPECSVSSLGVQIGMTLEDAERLLIEATLAHAVNNKSRAAVILGISAKTLHAKLKQYRLATEENTDEASVSGALSN